MVAPTTLRSQKTLNKIDFFSFKTISKNGNSHAIDNMFQIKEEESLILLPNNGPATVALSFLQLPNNDGPAQFTQLSVSNDGRAITTLSFLHLHVPFRVMTCANLLLLPIWDNPAMVTHAQNLLPCAHIGSAINMVSHAQNLCCSVSETTQQLRWWIMTIPSFIWLLHSFEGLWLLKSLLLTHFQFQREHDMLKSIFKLSSWSLITFVVPILWEHIKSLHPLFPTTISSRFTYCLHRKNLLLHIWSKALSLIALQAIRILRKRMQLKTIPARWFLFNCQRQFHTFPIDCQIHIFKKIPSLLQRLWNILWGRMGATMASMASMATMATWRPQRPC